MSQGFDTPVDRDLIAIETDDVIYFVTRIKKDAKEALKAHARKYRIFRGKLVEDIRYDNTQRTN